MRKGSALAPSPAALTGLFFIQRYRFLTSVQFAKASGLSVYRASDLLRLLEQREFLGHFGNVIVPGAGKTPKAYYLTHKGFQLLRRESGIPDELLGYYVEPSREASWSPQMYHRLRLVDLMLALEIQVRERPHLNLVRTFLEYRRRKIEGRISRETTDFVATEETPENRIIPDAAFVLENLETGRRGLFFVEMDMATERIVTQISHDKRVTLHHKFEQYDRYLTSGRYATTYEPYGEFRHFTLLFVTQKQERIDNILHAVSDLPDKLHSYYRFATFEEATADFLGPVWKSRLISDTRRYALAR